jgi:cytochrome c oxidase cbb3-type subunit 2
MEIFSNHIRLYGLASLFFVGLSIAVVILPALDNQNNNAPLPGSELLRDDALAGKHVFIANGCVACHSQQVRNIAMDRNWGTRPSVAADYAANKRMTWMMNTATLMGTERTGPDLTDIGNRLPSVDWHLLHLYNPRAVVAESIMPAYPWMFKWTREPGPGEKEVNVPENFSRGREGEILIAKKEAMQLVAYLQSLKQTPLPTGTAEPSFLYDKKTREAANAETKNTEPDGALLYANNCQACHQANGEGLKGAFPALKGSKIVVDDNPEVLIDIIINGYDAREEFAQMPPVGTNNKLTAAEITAIANHERTSWGNNGHKLSAEEVSEIIALLKRQTPNQ